MSSWTITLEASEASMAQPTQPNCFGPKAVTLAALVAYRLGAQLPLPGIDLAFLSQSGANDLSSPSVLGRVSILALGVVPWFSALTLVELLIVLLPRSWLDWISASGQAQPSRAWLSAWR